MSFSFKKYHSEKYWKNRDRIYKWKFGLRKRLYSFSKFRKDQTYKRKSFWAHLTLTLWNIVKAIVFVFILFTIEYAANIFWISYLDNIPSWLVSVQNAVPKPTYPNDRDAIIELLSIIASVTGVILALFYPVIATIASTAYAKVHTNVRSLLLSEKETQGYLRRLTYLTAFSLVVLLMVSFGYKPGNLILTFLLLYCLIVLFGILKIGLGVYNLLEPTSLLGLVIEKLKTSIEEVTSQSPYYDDRSFQNFHRQIANDQIENMELITNLSINNGFQESSFLKCNRNSFSTLNFYLGSKATIPRNSEWFPMFITHKSYFESDMTARGLSKNTSTYVQPKQEKNNLWFEERIIESASKAINQVISIGRHDLLGKSIIEAQNTIELLGRQFNIVVAEKLLKELKVCLIDLSKKLDLESKSTDYSDWRSELESIEAYTYTVFAFQFGLLVQIGRLNSTNFASQYNTIDWQDNSSIYKTSFIPELHSSLDRFIENHKNEIAVEGKRITPDWYYKQSLCAQYLMIVSKKLHDSIELTDKYLVEVANLLDKSEMPLLASLTCHVGLEVIGKIRFRLEESKRVLDGLDIFEKSKGEFTWSKPDYEAIEKSLVKYERRFVGLTVKNIIKISELDWTNNFPDVFAQSYSITSTYLNLFFQENDEQLFAKTFPQFLKAAFKAFENNNRNFKHYNMPQNISYQTLLDLLEISGYAYIYSEIHGGNYWETTRKAWNEEFVPLESNINTLAGYYQYYKSSLYGTGINYTDHSEREKALRDVVRKQNIRTSSNPLVNIFIPDSDFGSIHYSTAELFLELYLFTFMDAKNAASNMQRREIFNQMVRLNG